MKIHYRSDLKKIGRSLRSAGNLAEALLWKELKAQKLGVQFLRQRPILNYVVDFYCEKLKFAIEIDGVSHDSKVEQDIVRQRTIESEGIRVLRCMDNDICHNMDSVVRTIKESIKSSVR